MKKIVLTALVLVLVLPFTGCADNSRNESTDSGKATVSSYEKNGNVSDASEMTADSSISEQSHSDDTSSKSGTASVSAVSETEAGVPAQKTEQSVRESSSEEKSVSANESITQNSEQSDKTVPASEISVTSKESSQSKPEQSKISSSESETSGAAKQISSAENSNQRSGTDAAVSKSSGIADGSEADNDISVSPPAESGTANNTAGDKDALELPIDIFD